VSQAFALGFWADWLITNQPLRPSKILHPMSQRLDMGQLVFTCAGVARPAAGVGARRTAGLETGATTLRMLGWWGEGLRLVRAAFLSLQEALVRISDADYVEFCSILQIDRIATPKADGKFIRRYVIGELPIGTIIIRHRFTSALIGRDANSCLAVFFAK